MVKMNNAMESDCVWAAAKALLYEAIAMGEAAQLYYRAGEILMTPGKVGSKDTNFLEDLLLRRDGSEEPVRLPQIYRGLRILAIGAAKRGDLWQYNRGVRDVKRGMVSVEKQTLTIPEELSAFEAALLDYLNEAWHIAETTGYRQTN